MIAECLGLFGTVVGLFLAFQTYSGGGLSTVSGAIAMAQATTIFGLATSIIARLEMLMWDVASKECQPCDQPS